MPGYDAATGRPLYGDARIVQAIKRLVVTRGSLVMRRHLTCELPNSIGTPQNPIQRQVICAGIAGAIYEHEKRVDLQVIRLASDQDGTTPEDAASGSTRVVISALSKETGKVLDFSEVIR